MAADAASSGGGSDVVDITQSFNWSAKDPSVMGLEAWNFFKTFKVGTVLKAVPPALSRFNCPDIADPDKLPNSIGYSTITVLAGNNNLDPSYTGDIRLNIKCSLIDGGETIAYISLSKYIQSLAHAFRILPRTDSQLTPLSEAMTAIIFRKKGE